MEYTLVRIIRIIGWGNMAKRLCKLDRKHRGDNLSDIARLVAEPKYFCRSCSRASSEKKTLCKPTAIASLTSTSLTNCVAIQSAPRPISSPTLSIQPLDRDKAQVVRAVVERVKQKVANDNQRVMNKGIDADNAMPEELDEKALKHAKKALKKQYKQHKKLHKLAKKQRKLLDKQKKIEAKLTASKPVIATTSIESVLALH